MMNPDNSSRKEVPEDSFCSDIKETNNVNDYIINAEEADRLVYCRFGKKHIEDMIKRKNSNISCLNSVPATQSYLINVKKLIEENNIDGEKKDFSKIKSTNLGKK